MLAHPLRISFFLFGVQMRFFIQIITHNTFISGLVVFTFLHNNLFQVKEVERKLQEAQKCLCDCKEKVTVFSH